MTKTLTEQWREGTLADGYYYIDYDTQQRIFEVEDGCATYQGLPAETYFLNDVCLIKVLAPVPSYDKVKEMSQKIERLEFDNEALEMAHNEGKEINAELVSKNEQLEKRLKIATKALKGVCVWANTGNGGEQAVKKVCDKALKEIEEVK